MHPHQWKEQGLSDRRPLNELATLDYLQPNPILQSKFPHRDPEFARIMLRPVMSRKLSLLLPQITTLQRIGCHLIPTRTIGSIRIEETGTAPERMSNLMSPQHSPLPNLVAPSQLRLPPTLCKRLSSPWINCSELDLTTTRRLLPLALLESQTRTSFLVWLNPVHQ
jgi:hypothetical protein